MTGVQTCALPICFVGRFWSGPTEKSFFSTFYIFRMFLNLNIFNYIFLIWTFLARTIFKFEQFLNLNNFQFLTIFKWKNFKSEYVLSLNSFYIMNNFRFFFEIWTNFSYEQLNKTIFKWTIFKSEHFFNLNSFQNWTIFKFKHLKLINFQSWTFLKS